MNFFVYGNGNPFVGLLALGFPGVADLVATTLCDSTSRWLVFVPAWVKDAADMYAGLRGYNFHCHRCIKLLWQPHEFEGYHDACYQEELDEEAQDAMICNDLASDVLFHLEMEDLLDYVSITTMSDASFQQWLDTEHPGLDEDIRSLALERFRAGELRR